MDAPMADIEKQARQAEEPTVEERRKRKKKQIFDDLTELEGRGRGGLGPLNAVDVSSILTDHQYLPRSSVVMRLLEIREDPISHFLPTKVTPNGTFFFAGPPGIAPELQEMFMRPISTFVPASKRRGTSPEKPPSKRARIEPEGEVSAVPEDEGEPGQARRASVAPSQGIGSEVLGARESVGPVFEFDNTGLGMEDFQMDIGGEDIPPVERIREKSVAPSELTRISRASTPAVEAGEGEETYADLECPIAVFDMKGSSQVSEDSAGANSDGKGYSKNTVRALGIVRKELEPAEGDAEDKVMSFNHMATKVTILTPPPVRTLMALFPVDPPCSGSVLFRASCPRNARLRQAISISAIREHRSTPKNQTMGAPAAWIYCAIYIFIYGLVIEHTEPFFFFLSECDLFCLCLCPFFMTCAFTITISQTRDTSDPH